MIPLATIACIRYDTSKGLGLIALLFGRPFGTVVGNGNGLFFCFGLSFRFFLLFFSQQTEECFAAPPSKWIVVALTLLPLIAEIVIIFNW